MHTLKHVDAKKEYANKRAGDLSSPFGENGGGSTTNDDDDPGHLLRCPYM